MRMRRDLCFIVMLLGVAATACDGGSGSSGFDVRSENAAIALALLEQQCVPNAGLLICPADETKGVPGNEPTPSGTPTQPPLARLPRVDTGIGTATAIACMQAASDAGCSFTLPFAPAGFPSGAVFRVAVRVNETGFWTIGPALASSTMPMTSFDAPVSVGAPANVSPGSVSVQLAVLVFLKPVSAVPAQVDVLAATGADYAFVTTTLTLQPLRAPSSSP